MFFQSSVRDVTKTEEVKKNLRSKEILMKKQSCHIGLSFYIEKEKELTWFKKKQKQK